MRAAVNKKVLGLLMKGYNQAITDYFYFPEVIYAGSQKLERDDFDALLTQGLIQLSRFDSFGRYYHLSKKGESLLQQHAARPAKRKSAQLSLTQGCFYFNRHAQGARCLLFL